MSLASQVNEPENQIYQILNTSNNIEAYKQQSLQNDDYQKKNNQDDGFVNQSADNQDEKKEQFKNSFHLDNFKNDSADKDAEQNCAHSKNQNHEKSSQLELKQFQNRLLNTQPLIQQAQLKLILRALLQRRIICQYTKRLIYLVLQRPQGKANFHHNISIKERQKSRNKLKALNQKRVFLDETKVSSISKEQYKKDLEQFIDLLSEFELNDYAYLYHHQGNLQNFIGQILNNFDFFRPFYQPYFERFYDLIKIKIQSMPLSKIVYQKIYLIQRKLKAKMGYKGSRKKLNIVHHLTDLLFQHYIQQLQNKPHKQIYYVRDPKTDQKIPLSEFMASCKEYFNHLSGWKDILFIVAKSITEQDPNYDSDKDEIIVENIPTQTCLGCSQFFLVNRNINQPEICKHILVILGSVSQIDNYAAHIKGQICALLNGKGGVMLFDCERSYNTVIPRGAFIIQKEKESIQRKLIAYLDGIYPKPLIGKNIFISLVPIVQLKQVPNRNSVFHGGIYVGRIVVKPTNGHVAYFWTQNEKPIFSIRTESLFPQGKRQISGRDVHKFIKRKFKDFDYEFIDLHPIERKAVMKPVCTMNHECKKPEYVALTQMCLQIQETNVTTKQLEHKYKYASVVIAKKSDHEVIRKKMQGYNIECVIVAPFENLKLKGADHLGIMYHNTRFDELLWIISRSKDFQFSGKNLFVILITQYIRLTERKQRNIMPQGDFNSLTVWLHKNYPNETLKMWKFITDNNDQQFYIQTESKQSSLYIYIVMNLFLERPSFKNPKGLERMDQRLRQQRLKQIDPRNHQEDQKQENKNSIQQKIEKAFYLDNRIILILKRQYRDAFKQIMQREGILCIINDPPETTNHVNTINCFIMLLHSLKKLMEVLKRSKFFKMEARQVLTKEIKKIIPFTTEEQQNGLTNIYIGNLIKQFNLQYPCELLKVEHYPQLYFETGGRQSPFYIYFIMSQPNERFDLESPHQLEKK